MEPFSNRPFAVSRRRFCQAAGAAGAACATMNLGSSAPTAVAAQTKRQFPPGRYVDMHTHLGQTWNTTKLLTAQQLLAWMDDNDIAQAVVLPLVSPESSSFLLTSDFVLDQTRPHRDRLIPFCCIDPRTSYTGGKKALLEILKRWVEQGARGFGEHKTGVKIDDPRNLIIYEACGELKLPILYHSDTERNLDAPGLSGLAAYPAAIESRRRQARTRLRHEFLADRAAPAESSQG